MSAKSTKITKKKIDLPEEVVEKNDNILHLNRMSKIFLCLLAFGFFLFVALKFSGSSVGMHDIVFSNKNPPKSELIFGQPRGIRQDEWQVWLPMLYNSYQNKFADSIYSMGAGKAALICSALPTNSIRDFFRPKLWWYHFLDFERGYSFDWNLKIFGLLATAFLFFMIFTKSNFLLSFFGAFWLFLSSAQQWWSNNLGEMLSYVLLAISSFLIIIFTKKKYEIYVFGLLFIIGAYTFITIMYPPWTIALGYIGLLFTFGYLFQNWDSIKWHNLKTEKILILSLSTLFVGILILLYYFDIRSTAKLITETSYPGKRVNLGGDFDLTKLFSEYLGIFMTDNHYPEKWLNICEASGFLMFFPILIFYFISVIKNKLNINYFYLVFFIFLIFWLVWMNFGLPNFIAKATLLNHIPSYRLLPIIGIANILFTVIFLSHKIKISFFNNNLYDKAILFVVSFVFLYMILTFTNAEVKNFFTTGQILSMSMLFACLYLVASCADIPYRNVIFSSIVLIYLFPNIKVNPLMKGLRPLLKHPVITQVKSIPNLDNNAKWIVFGNVRYAAVLFGANVNIFNGVKNPPNLDDFKHLDPEKKDINIYNRGGYINVAPYITGTDSVVFKLNENNVVNDTYSLFLDPCSDKLKKTGVKYVMFTYEPQPAEIRCMKLLSKGVTSIYEITN